MKAFQEYSTTVLVHACRLFLPKPRDAYDAAKSTAEDEESGDCLCRKACGESKVKITVLGLASTEKCPAYNLLQMA